MLRKKGPSWLNGIPVMEWGGWQWTAVFGGSDEYFLLKWRVSRVGSIRFGRDGRQCL